MEADNIKPLLQRLKELEFWLDGVLYLRPSGLHCGIDTTYIATLEEAGDVIETYHQRLYGGTNNDST